MKKRFKNLIIDWAFQEIENEKNVQNMYKKIKTVP
jgi:ribose 5-phosphate isomerase